MNNESLRDKKEEVRKVQNDEHPTGLKIGKSARRRATSLTLFLSGIIVIASSVVLYLCPPSHVAFFSDWTLLGLTMEQWNAIHVVNGILFMFGMLLHSYDNWKAVLSYLMDKRKKVVIFTKAFSISVVITSLICFCSAMFLPPAKQIMHLGHSINQGHLRSYGVFPYGDAKKYTVNKTAVYLGMDADRLVSRLRKNGITVTSVEQSIAEVAESNGICSRSVFGALFEVLQNPIVGNLREHGQDLSDPLDLFKKKTDLSGIDLRDSPVMLAFGEGK